MLKDIVTLNTHSGPLSIWMTLQGDKKWPGTWVGLTLSWVFHQLAPLPSRFCQIPISPSRIRQTVERSKSKSNPQADGTPCTNE